VSKDAQGRKPVARPSRPADVSKVAVGSRAEAKALRKRAEEDARARAKATFSQSKRTRTDSLLAERAKADAVDGIVCWNVPEAAVVLGVLLLTLVAKNTLLSMTAFGLMPESGRIAARATLLAIFYALQLGTLVWLASRHKAGLGEAFGLRRLGRGWVSSLTSAGAVLGMLVVTRLASTAFGAIAQASGWEPPARSASDFTQLFGAGGPGIALSVLMVVALGPFVEELVFRGVILRAAESRVGAAWAIVLQAALFAAYHLTPWLIVPSFVLGLACGWLAWQRRSLWPAIALHALYNGVAVAAVFYVAG